MQAMLILAHKNVDQVLQLASKLNRRFEVYIHFDTKCPVSEKEKSFMDDNGIKHISEVDVNWGSWSIGEAGFEESGYIVCAYYFRSRLASKKY